MSKTTKPQDPKQFLTLMDEEHFNPSTIPIQVQYGEVLEVFHSERECVIKHDEFFSKAKRENQPIAPSFNLGCVPLKEDKKWTKPGGASNANVTAPSSNEIPPPV